MRCSAFDCKPRKWTPDEIELVGEEYFPNLISRKHLRDNVPSSSGSQQQVAVIRWHVEVLNSNAMLNDTMCCAGTLSELAASYAKQVASEEIPQSLLQRVGVIASDGEEAWDHY